MHTKPQLARYSTVARRTRQTLIPPSEALHRQTTMTSRHLRHTLTVLLSLSLIPIVYSVNFFPCHPSKAEPNNDVLCSRVVLPPRLCKSCPLRPTDDEGSFVDCQRIYDTESPECHQALQQYVDQNECDHVRREALKGLKEGDDDARSVMDYFLYSICEECCDCVPMGTKRTDYIALASAHKPDEPYLWSEARGNCPAHAQFDVCKVLPHAEYFTKPGGDEIDAPKACPLLRQWQNSDAATEWQLNPEAEIQPEIETFLRGLLNAIDCDNFSIWTKCHDLEEKQNHLVIEEEFADKKPKIPRTEPPSTSASPSSTKSTATEGTTATTTASGSTNDDKGDKNNKNNKNDKNDKDGKSDDDSDDDSSGGSDNDSDDVSLPSDTSSGAVGESTPSTSPSTSTSPSSNSSPASCFPSTGIVELRSGKLVSMNNLQIGDWVRVSEEEFSQVFLFTHRTAFAYERFVEITVGNQTLQVTNGHLVYANGVAVPAEVVRKGDIMRTVDGIATVEQVRRVYGRGLYNPQTLNVNGDIVVDGVVVSTYTTSIERNTGTALLTPIRGLFRLGWVGERSMGGWFREGYRSILPIPMT